LRQHQGGEYGTIATNLKMALVAANTKDKTMLVAATNLKAEACVVATTN